MKYPIGYNKRIEIDKDVLYELYIEQKMTSREIAELFNTSKRVILKRIKEHEIEIRPKVRINQPGFWLEYGYKILYAEGGKHIREHINVMEMCIGRKLEKNEVVHHINKNKLDNRIENLRLMTRGEHSILHHTGAKYNMRKKGL